jgi:hypothetical protein
LPLTVSSSNKIHKISFKKTNKSVAIVTFNKTSTSNNFREENPEKTQISFQEKINRQLTIKITIKLLHPALERNFYFKRLINFNQISQK